MLRNIDNFKSGFGLIVIFFFLKFTGNLLLTGRAANYQNKTGTKLIRSDER